MPKRKNPRVIWLSERNGVLDRITEYYRWQAARNGKPIKFIEEIK